MLDNIKSDVIALVKSAITGENQKLSDDFNISNVLGIAKRHQIQGLIYYGALNCGVDNSLPAMQQLFMSLCNIIAISEQQMFELNRVFEAFSKKGIDYMPLKGTLLKKLYPRPDMRIMGDADILIKTKDYDRIKPIMLELGFSEKVESDHELNWTKPGILFELHKRLIPSYNKDYYAYYGDGWRLAVPCESIAYRFEMTKEDQMIYLLTHFAKHYRDGGIGIRHLTDLYVFRKTSVDFDEKYIKAELKKLELYDFYVNIVDTISAWFEDTNFDLKTEFITEVIFSSGAYGHGDRSFVAQATRASKKDSIVKNAKLRYLLTLIFPKKEAMIIKYSFLEKAPFLLPLAWVMRLFKIAFSKRNKAKRFYTGIKKIDSQEISNYSDSLHFVGLDFNFKE